MSSILLLMQLLLAACCHYINITHAQQQVSLSGSNQLSITVKARKINFSPSTSNESLENSFNLANNRRNEPSKQQRHAKRTKIITTTSEIEAQKGNYRKSRIIVKETFNDSPLKLSTGFRPVEATRQYPLLYPFVEKFKPRQQRLSGIQTKTTMSNKDWTPIAYVLENFGVVGSEQPEMSTNLKVPMRDMIIYGTQRPVDQHFLGEQTADLYDQHLFQARIVKPDKKISENSGALANFGQQHKPSERIKQLQVTQKELLGQNQSTDDRRENATNRPVENIALNNMEESKQKKPVKNTEMANMSNSSIVTMKISLRRAIKNTTKLNSSSSSSSASSTAGHSNLNMMSTHQMPFKSNETTWPLSDKTFATSPAEASLADSALKTSSSEFSSSTPSSPSTTELSTLASTSSKATTSAFSTPSTSLASTKLTSSSTSSILAKSSNSASIASATHLTSNISSFVLTSTVNASTTITSNNLTTAEPKICVPMLVRENSTVNLDSEFIETERIVCFPLPPDSNLNFNDLVEDSVEVIKLAVKDRNLHEDYWNSRMNSRSNSFDKNMVLLYLTMLCWYL